MDIEIVYLLIFHLLVYEFYSVIDNLLKRRLLYSFYIRSMSTLLLEKLIFYFLLNSFDNCLSITLFSWDFEKLRNCNHNHNVKYFRILWFDLFLIKQVRDFERSSCFRHNKTPESHRNSLTQLIQIDFSCLLIYIGVKLSFIIKLIT